MSQKKAIRVEVQFTGFSSRADGSLGFRGVTPELSTDEKVAMMDLQGLLVDMMAYPKEDRDAELVEVKKDIDCKSPSQRLRSVLFLLYKQSEDSSTFQIFYDRHMEKLINHVKAKLDGG